MPMLLCDYQSFIKESYLLTYLRRAQTLTYWGGKDCSFRIGLPAHGDHLEGSFSEYVIESMIRTTRSQCFWQLFMSPSTQTRLSS